MFEHYALRACEAGFQAGDTLPNSFVWVDGECFEDEELNGSCGYAIASEEPTKDEIQYVRNMYSWGDRQMYIIGGDWIEQGQDNGEIIIRQAQVIRVLNQ